MALDGRNTPLLTDAPQTNRAVAAARQTLKVRLNIELEPAYHTCVPSRLTTIARTLSLWPRNLQIFSHDLGSQIRSTFSVEPATTTVPNEFMAKEYMLLLLP